jgi:hypothetical protein
MEKNVIADHLRDLLLQKILVKALRILTANARERLNALSDEEIFLDYNTYPADGEIVDKFAHQQLVSTAKTTDEFLARFNALPHNTRPKTH